MFKYRYEYAEYKHFDYSKQDSLFYAADTVMLGEEFLNEKKVDSNSELLDFRADDLVSNKPVIKSSKQSLVNINSAGIAQLIKLPGIGNKTAQRIIDYRQKIGKFTNVNQLLKVKGIGSAKLKKISKFIIVE